MQHTLTCPKLAKKLYLRVAMAGQGHEKKFCFGLIDDFDDFSLLFLKMFLLFGQVFVEVLFSRICPK